MENKQFIWMMIIVIFVVLPVIIFGEYYRYGAYKRMTHSNIDFGTYLLFNDKIKIIAVSQ